MALLEYQWRGNTWQFDEAEAPADAVPLTRRPKAPASKPSRKVATPKKTRTPADTAAKPADNKEA